MSGLVPFNRRRTALSNGAGFGDFYNMLDDFFSGGDFPQRNLARDTFKIDVEDADSEYKIHAELPGVTKDEIGLELSDEGRLTISVNKTECAEEEKKNYIHRERRVCSMSRSVYLGDTDPNGIKAKLDNGVLLVTVEKKAKAKQPVQIEIE